MRDLVSLRVTVKAGKDGKLMQMTKPSKAALDVGYKPQGYFHLNLSPKATKDSDGDTKLKLKSESFTFYENQYPDLYNTISDMLAEESYVKTNNKENGVHDALLKGVVLTGCVLTAKVPLYEIWNMNKETGKEEPFMSQKRQPDGTMANTVNVSNKVKVVYLEEMNVDPEALLEDAKDAAAKHRVLADDNKSIPEQEKDDE